VLRLFGAKGARLLLLGSVFGLAASLASARLFAHLLFHVSPADPVTLLSVLTLLSVVSALAVLLPTSRALRIDPVAALRHE
jgi:ABC-type antimicrobial peptide transport system permease subunit